MVRFQLFEKPVDSMIRFSPYNEVTGEGNGFSFTDFNAHDMLYTIRRAINFYQDQEIWRKLMTSAMEMKYSWAESAFKYNQLYSGLVSRSDVYVLK